MGATTTLHKRGKVSQQSVFPFSRSLVSQSFLESCKTWARERGKTATSDDSRSGGQAENWKSSLGKQRERERVHPNSTSLSIQGTTIITNIFSEKLQNQFRFATIMASSSSFLCCRATSRVYWLMLAGRNRPKPKNLPWVNFRWHRKKVSMENRSTVVEWSWRLLHQNNAGNNIGKLRTFR